VPDADEDNQLTIEALHSTIPVAFTLVKSTNMNFFYAIVALICKISISKGMTGTKIPRNLAISRTKNSYFLLHLPCPLALVFIYLFLLVYSANGIACFSGYLCRLKKKDSYLYGLLSMKLQVQKTGGGGNCPTHESDLMRFVQWLKIAQACHTTILSLSSRIYFLLFSSVEDYE
jgi:hypothetical protein